MRFFESKNVKIFPCFSRGTYICNSDASTTEQVAAVDNAEDNSASTRVFDPEARLITEASLTSLYGNVLGHKNYIVEIDEDNNRTKVVIQGYYFEITDFEFTSGTKLAIKLKSIEFTNPETNLIDSNRSTYKLSSLATDSDVLDYLEASTNTYYCTAIGLVTSDEELTDDMSILFFDDNVLRLDAKDNDALAIFTAGHAQTLKETKDFVDSLGTFQGKEGEEETSQFDRVKASIESITAESLGLNAFVDESPASLKESFTGEVVEGSEGFALGKNVYEAIQQLEARLGGVTNVMNFRGAVNNFTDVENPVEGDVITFSTEFKDGDAVVAKASSEWVYSNKEWVEIGTASASDAAIAILQSRMTEAEGDIDDLEAEFATDGRVTAIETAVEFINDTEDGILAQANAYADGLADNYDTAGAAAEAKSEVIGTSADPKTADTVYGAKAFATDAVDQSKIDLVGGDTDTTYAKTIKGAKEYAKDYANSLASNYDEKGAADLVASVLTGAETDTETELTLYGLQRAITVLKGDESLGEAPDSLRAEAAARSGADVELQTQITNLTDSLNTHLAKTAEHTNTAHSHTDGLGTTVTGTGGIIESDVVVNLNLEFAGLGEDKKLKLVDKTSKKVVAEFDATDFIKDGMLDDVAYSADTNELTFMWNTDSGKISDVVKLTDILDPYEFKAGDKLAVTVDGTKVTYAHETVTAPTETTGTGGKYLTSVTTDGYGHITGFTTVDQDLSAYKVTQSPIIDPRAEGNGMEFIATISQNAQGVITATKQTVNAYTKEEVYNKEDIDKIKYSLGISGTTKLSLSHTNVRGDTSSTQVDLTNSITKVFEDLLGKLRFYEVDFNNNGGSGYMSSRIVVGPEYSLPKGIDVKYTAPCSTHQQFKGWSLSSDGLDLIESYTFVDDDESKTTRPTFYAIWETIPNSLTKYDAKAATCEDPGNLDYYWCDACKTAFEDSNATQKLDNYLTEALGHDWADATCLAPKTCKREGCDATEGEALGHSFTNFVSDNNATCTTDGTKTAKCDRCDETQTQLDTNSKLEHNYVDGICSICNSKDENEDGSGETIDPEDPTDPSAPFAPEDDPIESIE